MGRAVCHRTISLQQYNIVNSRRPNDKTVVCELYTSHNTEMHRLRLILA